MEISIIKPLELVESNIISDIQPYDISQLVEYEQGSQWHNGNHIFEYVGDTFTPKMFSVVDESTYEPNEVIFKNGSTVRVTSVGTVPETAEKQPEDYTAQSNGLNSNIWNSPYALIAEDESYWGFTKVVNGVTHEVYETGYNLYHKVSYANSGNYWGVYRYQYWSSPTGNNSFVRWAPSDGALFIDYPLETSWNTLYNQPEPTPYVTIFTAPNGTRYKCGAHVRTLSDGRKMFAVSQEMSGVAESFTLLMMTDEVDINSTYLKATCGAGAPCGEKWGALHMIRRPAKSGAVDKYDYYVPTGLGTKETFTAVINTYEDITDLTYFKNMSNIGFDDQYKPIDGKNYTHIVREFPLPLEYAVMAKEPINTIGLTGLIADSVTAKIYASVDDYNNDVLLEEVTVDIDNSRDVAGRLSDYQTTAIIYATQDVPKDGVVKLIFESTEFVRIGGIQVGLSVDAGFTNLSFTNKFNDYSPYERDQWGNVLYVDGVKTNVYTGTVDIPLVSYDMINRLMASIGGKTVILNGSDTKNNQDIDSVNFFASTMVVGRIRNFSLKTKLDNAVLAQMATYNFQIEEDV